MSAGRTFVLTGPHSDIEVEGPLMDEVIFVDPYDLRLPPSRIHGADPGKLARQISRFGRDVGNMPAIEVMQDGGGLMKIADGVTRATRAAKLAAGAKIPAIVIGNFDNADYSMLPTIGERLP